MSFVVSASSAISVVIYLRRPAICFVAVPSALEIVPADLALTVPMTPAPPDGSERRTIAHQRSRLALVPEKRSEYRENCTWSAEGSTFGSQCIAPRFLPRAEK